MKDKFFENKIDSKNVLRGVERRIKISINDPELGNTGQKVWDIHYDDNNNGVVDSGDCYENYDDAA